MFSHLSVSNYRQHTQPIPAIPAGLRLARNSHIEMLTGNVALSDPHLGGTPFQERRKDDQGRRPKKYTRSIQSHFPVSLNNCNNARTRPPMSAGEIVFSSTKTTPPCRRPSSAQILSNGGIVLRS